MRRGLMAILLMAGLASAIFVPERLTGAAPAKARMAAGQVARFIAADADESALPPSFALVKDLPDQGPPPEDWKVRPRFESSARAYAAVIDVPEGTSLYGTGETAGPLERTGRVTETWNGDHPSYSERNKALYQSHPWVLAVRADGSAFGVLADTTYRCKMDLRNGVRFSTKGHPFPVYVIEGGSPQAVVKKLGELTGTITMPPLWALGYQQCRWSYYPDTRVKEIADGFRSRKIPCDVIWLDIHYMDGYRVFTFDQKRFPDPKGLNDYLHSKDFKSVWMIDPGVKKDPGYFVYDQGTAGDHWVKTKRGEPFIGSVWPGPCVFPDFTRPETRVWWAGLYQDYMALGIDGVWNDMNEPSVFDKWPRTMPTSNLHRGGGDLPPGTHELYHNVYGMLMVRATREGVMAANPEKRPFVLTRSNFIGGQRYAATWTGDNYANWDHVQWSVNMILNMGLSGQPFVGPDIGGFSGKGTPEMFARWFGFGAFFPFSRGHAATGNIDKEPWVFGPKVESTCRTALQRRYRLLPYYYTLFHEASINGMPVMRPAFFADPADPALREEEQAFLVGSDLLVLAQLDKDGGHQHALPQGVWRKVSLIDGDDMDPDQPELRIRGGAIIPAGRVIEHTGEKSLDPLTLIVSLDESGRASGTLYEDAGEGWAYQDGEYLLTTYDACLEGGLAVVKVSGSEGDMARPARKVIVELITDRGVIRAQGTEDEPIMIDLVP